MNVINIGGNMKILTLLLLLTLGGCSAMSGLALDTITSGSKDGIEATAQVGKENSKGLVNAKLDTSANTEADDVTGDMNVGSGNTTNNEALPMIGLVLSGLLPPLLLIFYFLPTPRWVARRHKEDVC